MRRVASVATALAVAATLSQTASAGAAPAKMTSDGLETLHIENRQSPLFGIDPLHLWPFSFSEFGRDWPRFEPNDTSKSKPGGPGQAHLEEHHFLYFYGGDLWPHWAFAHIGALWSPGGLSAEGFTVKALLSGGAYTYRAGALNDVKILAGQYQVTLMPGWRFKHGSTELTVFAGFDLQYFTMSPVDPGTRLIGHYTGLRTGFELWHEPSPATMLAADASASSIRAGDHARVAFVWRLFDRFYFGPEAQLYRTDPYVHRRVGLHVTAFKTEDHEWSGAIGYASDNDNRSGIYFRIGVLARR